MDRDKDRVKDLLLEGLKENVYPGAVLLVAKEGKIVSFHALGHRSLIPFPDSINRDTIFDLASLTKPLATTLAIMKLVDEGKIDLDQTLERLLPGDLPRDKKTLTPRLLLSHCAGFADWKPFYLELDDVRQEKRKDIVRERILKLAPAYQAGKETLYSDLGFMVLEWVIEEKAGSPMHLFLNHHFYGPLELNRTFLSINESQTVFEEVDFAATEDCQWRRKIIRGSVHDENAYSLGGYSGHSGLFGTAKDVYTLVNLLSMHFNGERSDYLRPETVRIFFSRQNIVNGSTWALGWDTPSTEASSAGKYFSANSVGHLGFTGTSVWMDLKKDVIVVFLTNRVHPTRDNERIKAFRPMLHNLIMEELSGDKS
jgi:CubicO group peptidase (beta-lactamase class C family)